MKVKQRVYICGPYSNGDQSRNVNSALLAGNIVLAQGGIPFIPHLFHFWHFIDQKPKQDWLYIDKQMLHAMHSIVTLVSENSYTEGMHEELNYNEDFLHLPVYNLSKVVRDNFMFVEMEDER